MSCLSTIHSEPTFHGTVEELFGRKMQLKRNQFVLLNSYPFPAVFYIVKGMVRMGAYLEKGGETTYCLLPEDHVFLAGMPTESHWINFAQSCTDVVNLRIYQQDQLKSFNGKDHPCSLDMVALQQKHISCMERQMQMLSCQNIHHKLAHFVLFLADLYGYRRQGVTYVPHSFTHLEIGKVLSLSRQSVTQTLRQLQKQGYIQYCRKKFVIPDYEKFQKIVKSKSEATALREG